MKDNKDNSQKDLLTYSVPLTELLEAGSHFGHQARRWNPKMAPFLYTVREGVHIFDLAQTSKRLAEACVAAKNMVADGKDIVFVGTKRQAQSIVAQAAKKAGAPYISARWLGGVLSNWPQIEKSIRKLIEMKDKKAKGEYKKYTKKENLLLDREISRLERFFGGLVHLTKAPEALFIVDVHREKTAVREAIAHRVNIFAITDSNADPTVVKYPIPANDDAVKSIKLIVETFAKAVTEGMAIREKTNKQINK